MEIDFEKMSEENKEYLYGEIENIFSKVLAELKSERARIEQTLGPQAPAIIRNLEVTPKGKLLFLAKKIAQKVIISKLTGIETMYLDSDTSGLIRKGYNFYIGQDISTLIYVGVKRLEEATLEFISKLANERSKSDILARMIKFYHATKGVDYGSGKKYRNGDDPQYGLPLAVFYDEVMSGKKDLYELVLATWNRGAAIGPDLDFLQELNRVYEKVSENVISKGR